MSRAPLVLLLSLAACAAAPPGEEWPSLAMRPGEVQPLVQRPAVATGAPTPASVARGDATSQLASIERDIAAFATRLSTQRAETAKAAAAGQGSALDSSAGSAAQLELTRLDRLSGQAADLRERLDRLAGDYARAGTAGPEFARIGAAIQRVEALRVEQATAYAAASAALRR